MNEVSHEDLSLIAEIHQVAQQITIEQGINETGYRLINNCGKDGEQTVHHLHYHLLGGARLGALTGTSSSHQ
ncbi:HIT-like protein [compost metagenome]